MEVKGPVIRMPLKDPSDLSRLREEPDDDILSSVYDALFLTRNALKGEAALIGFCGAPWSLFCFMARIYNNFFSVNPI